MIYTLAFGIFICSFLVQLYFWVFEFSGVKSDGSDTLPACSGPGISLVICAKNEAENLERLLPSILSQKYSPFEIIVVDDWSIDETSRILEHFKTEHRQVRVCHPDKDVPGKKYALTCGIAAAQYEHILLTDADCLPSSRYWLAYMVEPFNHDADVVLGAAPLIFRDKLISRFAYFDNILVFLLYASATLRGYSYMGVGRNMAYRKHLYEDRSQDGIIGGDDDLLISSLRNVSIIVQTHARAKMISEPPPSLQAFLHQKRRHTSPSWRYNLFTQVRLSVFAASHWLFYASFFYLLFAGHALLLIITLWICRGFLMIQRFRRSNSSLPPKFFSIALILDSLYIFYYPFIALFLVLKPTSRW